MYKQLAPGRSANPAAAGRPAAGRSGGSRAALLVETAAVQPRTFQSKLEVLGELKPQAAVEVMSRISGRLQQVLVDRGQSVRKGQLLAVVEDADLQQQMRRSEAAIAVARAGESREKAALDNLRTQLQRYRTLHKENLISTQDLQDLESRTRVAEAQVELAAAQVEQAAAALRELKIQQGQTRVYSPLGGVIGTRYLEPGALVSPGVPIVSLLDLDRVKTVVPVSEAVLKTVRVGLPAEVVVDAYSGRISRGRITRISPFLSPETRSADVEIEIPNSGWTLKPGMFARVKIDVNIAQNNLSIPRAALLARGTEKGVYLLSPTMTTIFRPIQVGRVEGDFVEVLGGVTEGQRVVSTGAQNVNEGDPVKLAQSGKRPGGREKGREKEGLRP